MNTTRRLLSLLCTTVLTTLSLSTTGVCGIEDRDNHNPTGTYWQYNVSLATFQSMIAKGYRAVDIEVTRVSPMLLTVSYVPNSGTFKKGWWWGVNQTAAGVTNLINTNKARIIDLEPYETSSGLRFAVLLESNSVGGKGWWWFYNTSTSYIYSQAGSLGARVVDLESYTLGSTTYYAAVLLKNTGVDAKSWWSYLNVDLAYVVARLSANQARLWDVDRLSNGNYNVTMVRSAGEGWWHFYGLTASQVNDYLGQRGARIMDIEQYGSLSSPRFNVVILEAANAVSKRVRNLMWAQTDGWMGVYLKQVNQVGTSPVLAYINGDRRFEPASSLKLLHLVHSMRQVYTTALHTNVDMTVNTAWTMQQSCPYAITPYKAKLQTVLEGMMRNSDNSFTKVITDYFGMSTLNATATSLGMGNTKINHHIGCGTPANYTSLVDLGILHERVINGYVGAERGNLYDIMINEFDAKGKVTNPVWAIVQQEAVKVGLSTSQRNSFAAQMRLCTKGGSYGVGGKFFRSIAGYLRLPIWSNGKIGQREFVLGSFVHSAAVDSKAATGVSVGYSEVMREEINKAMQTLKNHVFGSITYLGQSCVGSLPAYSFTAAGTPEIGERMIYTLKGANRRNSTMGTLHIGTDSDYWGRTKLPLSLNFLGATNCFWRTNALVALSMPIVAGGASLSAVTPLDKSLIGAGFRLQFSIAEPGANNANLIITNGIEVKVGGQR